MTEEFVFAVKGRKTKLHKNLIDKSDVISAFVSLFEDGDYPELDNMGLSEKHLYIINLVLCDIEIYYDDVSEKDVIISAFFHKYNINMSNKFMLILCCDIIYCERCIYNYNVDKIEDSNSITSYNMYNALLVNDQKEYAYDHYCIYNVIDMSHVTENDQIIDSINKIMYQFYECTQDIKEFIMLLHKMNNPSLMADILVYIDQKKKDELEATQQQFDQQQNNMHFCARCKNNMRRWW